MCADAHHCPCADRLLRAHAADADRASTVNIELIDWQLLSSLQLFAAACRATLVGLAVVMRRWLRAGFAVTALLLLKADLHEQNPVHVLRCCYACDVCKQ